MAQVPAWGFTINTGFSEGCHEGITYVAYTLAFADFPITEVPVPRGPWEDSADFLVRELGAPIRDRGELFFVHSLLTGVRSPDTDGGSALNLSSIRSVHLSETGQYAHCLRNVDDDGEEGDREAVRGCVRHILDTVDTARGFLAMPPEEQVILVNFSADFYGQFELQVWAPAYYIGRALHAIQDSFTHTIRSNDLRSIVHVMNYAEAIAGSLHERHDGMAHSASMDTCEGATEPLALAAIEASADLFRALTVEIADPGSSNAAIAVEKWVSYKSGCTLDNDYCSSPWVEIAREEPTEPYLCAQAALSRGRGGALGLCLASLLGVVLFWRRRG